MLQTEADLLRTLETGVYPLSNLYRLAEEAGLAERFAMARILAESVPSMGGCSAGAVEPRQSMLFDFTKFGS